MGTLLALDGTNIAHRAYFAAPNRYQALFTQWLDRLIVQHAPDEVYVAVDSPTCFRREIDPSYKTGRAEKSPELSAFIESFRSIYPCPDGFEADDLIATKVSIHAGDAIVVSGDKDLCALVSWRVRLVRPPDWGVTLGREDVFDLMGVWPDQVCAYKSLMGDPSDKISGVRGIGPVAAKRLLETCGTFEGVLDTLTPEQQEEARAAWRLVALRYDAPMGGT